MERIEGGRIQRTTPPKPAPRPEPWWSKHFLTIVLIGTAVGLVWYVARGADSRPSGPRPIVEFADNPVIKQGLTCDAEAGTLQIVRMDSAIRNVGAYEAQSVVQWPIHLVMPEGGGEPALPIAGASCASAPPVPMPAVSLNANATLNQFLAPEKSTFTPVGKASRLKLYTAVCVAYTDTAGAKFGTCATYQFVPSTGGSGFTCEGTVNGTYRRISSDNCGK
jgi:hypothetical protein